jgi:ribonuclease HII
MAKEKKILIEWPTGQFVAGLDEVGRGCGAGPVVTAAVIMPKGFSSPLIRDSKKLSDKQKDEAYKVIMDNAVSIVCNAGSVESINTLGIDTATYRTMHKCLDELSQKPDYILVDGTAWQPYKGTNGDNNALTLIPQGDDTYTCIAAAAIVAKVRRDEYMVKLHDSFPQYNWASNKGYLTAEHIAALKEHGSNKYHRIMYVKNFIK